MKMDGNFAGGFVGRKGEDYGRAVMRCDAGAGLRRDDDGRYSQVMS